MTAAIGQPLHVIDLDTEIDPLMPLVVDPATPVVARHLEHGVMRWRTSLELMRKRPGFLVAWGSRAFEVARRSGARHGIVRTTPWDPPPQPLEGWRAAPATHTEHQRLLGQGWSDRECQPIFCPGIDARSRLQGLAEPMRARGEIASNDFVWLVTGDSGRCSGLREGIWAVTVLHVMQRDRRAHRMLLWGDGPAHRRGRRFADQLGLPLLPVSANRCSYDSLAQIADAAVLLPSGPGSTWSASVVARAGLPAVINDDPDLQEVLGGKPHVRSAASEVRLIVREMRRLAQDLPPRGSPDERFAPGEVTRQWTEVCKRALSEASAG